MTGDEHQWDDLNWPSVETQIAIDRDSSSDPPVYSSLHPFVFQSAYPRDVHFFFFYRYIHLGGNTFTDHVRSSSEKDVRSWLLSDPLSLHLDSEFSFRFAIGGDCTWVAWAPILIDENWRMLSCCFPYYITVLIYHAALNALNRRILCCHRAKDKGTGHWKRWLSSNSKGSKSNREEGRMQATDISVLA